MSAQFIQLVRDHLPPGVPIIFEIGTRDCLDALEIAAAFPEAKVYAFEANPKTIPTAMHNSAKRPNVALIQKAVSEVDGVIPFYQSLTDNDGCSSALKASGKYDVVERMPQREIQVPSTRLDTFLRETGIERVDALWLDAQGSELSILKSLGDDIARVQAVWTEFCYDQMYEGQPLLDDLCLWLYSRGFVMVWKQDVLKDKTGKWWWGDAFFVRKG